MARLDKGLNRWRNVRRVATWSNSVLITHTGLRAILTRDGKLPAGCGRRIFRNLRRPFTTPFLRPTLASVHRAAAPTAENCLAVKVHQRDVWPLCHTVYPRFSCQGIRSFPQNLAKSPHRPAILPVSLLSFLCRDPCFSSRFRRDQFCEIKQVG